jgi:hypothetical protein
MRGMGWQFLEMNILSHSKPGDGGHMLSASLLRIPPDVTNPDIWMWRG